MGATFSIFFPSAAKVDFLSRVFIQNSETTQSLGEREGKGRQTRAYENHQTGDLTSQQGTDGNNVIGTLP